LRDCEVLCGHRVSDIADIDQLGPNYKNTVRRADFIRLIESRRDWVAMTPEDLLTGRIATSSAAPHYLMTFDDGYRDNLTDVLPILESANVPALVFVTTEFVGARRLPVEVSLALIIRAISKLRTPEGRVLPCGDDAAKRRLYGSLCRTLRRKGGYWRDEYLNELTVRNGVALPDTDGSFLTWDETRLLDRHPLVTVGAHTRSHPALNDLPDCNATSQRP